MYLYMHTTQQTEELTYYVLRESQYLAPHQNWDVKIALHHFNQINSSKRSLLLPQVLYVGKVMTLQGIHETLTCIREMTFIWTDSFATKMILL